MSEGGPSGRESRSGCATVREDLGAYVLGGLDDAEAAVLEQHLHACAACRGERDDLAALPPLLQLAADEVPRVPADLRDRVVAASTPRLDRRVWRRLELVAAAAALVGLLLGGAGGLWLGQRTPTPDAVVPLEAVGEADADGRAALRDTPSGMDVELSAEGLEPVERGYYHVWLEWPEGRRVSAGTFVTDDEGSVRASLRTGGWLEDYDALVITVSSAAEPDEREVLRAALD